MIAVFEVGALVVEASIRHFHYEKEKSNKYLGLYYPTWTCGLTMEEEMQTECGNAETEKSRDRGRDLSSAWSWESLLITPTLTWPCWNYGFQPLGICLQATEDCTFLRFS